MSDSRPPQAPSGEWTEALENYLSTVVRLAGRDAADAGAVAAAADSWARATERCWQSVGADAAPEVHELVAQLIEQARAYFRLSELIASAALAERGTQSAQGGAPEALLELWRVALEPWLRAAASGHEAGPQAGRAPRSAEAATVAQLFGAPPRVAAWERETRDGLRLWEAQQHACAEFGAEFQRLGVRTLEVLRERAAARARDGRPVTTLRELHELWVECGEEAYRNLVSSERYAELFGRLVNSSLAVRRHAQRNAGHLAAALDLPTRGEQEALREQLQTLRRELRNLRRELRAAGATAAPQARGGASGSRRRPR